MPLHYVCQRDICQCVMMQQNNTMNVSSQGADARSNSRHLVEMKIWSAVRAVAQASPSAPFCLRALPSVFSTGIIQRFRLKSARSFPVSGMRLRLWPRECCRHKQERAGKQAQAAQTKTGKHRQTQMWAQSSTAKHKHAGTSDQVQAGSFACFADISCLAEQQELCLQLYPSWRREANSELKIFPEHSKSSIPLFTSLTLGAPCANAIAALMRARKRCAQILQLRQVPIVLWLGRRSWVHLQCASSKQLQKKTTQADWIVAVW